MNKRRLYIAVLIVVTIVAMLQIRDIVTKTKKNKIYMIVKVDRAVNNIFWQTCKNGAETAVKEFGCDLVYKGAENENDIQAQINLIKNAIKDKPDAIVLAADSYDGMNSTAEEVVKNKIILLTMDSDISSGARKSYIGSDNESAGKEAGKKLADILNHQGDVAIINFINGSATANDREKGFREELSGYKNINILPTKFCDGDVEKSYSMTKELLQRNSSIKGIYGTNQPALEGIARAVKELGKTGSVKVVGFDSSEYITQCMENDIINAVIVQRPFNMGYLSVKSAVDAVNGKKLQSKIYTSYKLITKETIYTPDNEKLMFPFTE